MVRRSKFLGWVAAVALVPGWVAPAFAQASGNGEGEVTKIDKAATRIEIKHGEIKGLDMPPMRMLFRVRDAKMLDSVAVGDKVRFTVSKIDGQFTVTAIAKP